MEIAYIAGLLDGEGCITLVRDTKGQPSSVHVSIANSFKPALLSLQEKLGGKVYPARPSRGSRLTVWSWYLYGEEAVTFLHTVYPYLCVKREQALIALKFQETVQPRGWNKGGTIKQDANIIVLREELDKRLRSLKKVDFPAQERAKVDTTTLFDGIEQA